MPSETRIKNVKQDDDWFRIEVNYLDHPDWDGETLDTKKRDIATAARELKGEPVELDFTHKQNGRYNNFYLNSVLPGKKPEPEFERVEPKAQREYGYRTQPADAWRMCLNNGGDLAVRALPEAEFKEQVRYAYDWAKFFFFLGVPESMFTPFTDVMPQHSGQSSQPSQFQAPTVGSQSGFGDPPAGSLPPWEDPKPPWD